MLASLLCVTIWVAGVSLLLALNHFSAKARDRADKMDAWEDMLRTTLNNKNDY